MSAIGTVQLVVIAVTWILCDVLEVTVHSISSSSSSSSFSSSVTVFCSVLVWTAGELCEYAYYPRNVLLAWYYLCTVSVTSQYYVETA